MQATRSPPLTKRWRMRAHRGRTGPTPCSTAFAETSSRKPVRTIAPWPEEAYLHAFRIAQDQGAGSFGLQAALKLAKRYLGEARASEAREILSAALDGLPPFSELAEVDEARGLLSTLAERAAPTR
jgi:hypothetical protein